MSAPALGLLAHPAASGLAKRLWGARPSGCRVGLPRRIGAAGPERWLRRDDLIVELVRVPQDGARRAALLLPQGDAARLLDHLLGGDGQIGRVLALSEAESGVLAYAVGRALSELELPYQLADVRGVGGGEPWLGHPETVVWPHLLETTLGALDLRVALTSAAVEADPGAYELQLLLHDNLPVSEFAALEPGDLLISDRWHLTPTAGGLEGALELRAPGSSERLRGQLSQGLLRVLGVRTEALLPDGVDLLLGRACVSLRELVERVSGDPWRVSGVPMEPVELWRGEQCLLRGSLVVHRGALGLRVAQSMR